MKRIMFLGLCTLLFLPSCASYRYADAIPDNPLIKETVAIVQLDVNLNDELGNVSMDEGTACIFKQLKNQNGGKVYSNSNELFEVWKVYGDQPMEYRDLFQETKDCVININAPGGIAEIGKRIAFAIQFPKSLPHGGGQTIFAFITNGNGQEMVITAANDPEDGTCHFELKDVDHNCAPKGSMLINHHFRKS